MNIKGLEEKRNDLKGQMNAMLSTDTEVTEQEEADNA